MVRAQSDSSLGPIAQKGTRLATDPSFAAIVSVIAEPEPDIIDRDTSLDATALPASRGGMPRGTSLLDGWRAAFPPVAVDRRLAVEALLFTLMMVVTASVGIALANSTCGVAGIWLANGLAVAILLRRLSPDRVALLGGGFLGPMLAGLAAGEPVLTAAMSGVLNALEIAAVVGIAVRSTAFDGAFANTTIRRFTVTAMIVPAVTAALAAAWLDLTGGTAPLAGFMSWYGWHVLGLLIVAPLLLTLRQGSEQHSGGWHWIEALGIPLLGLMLTALVFDQAQRLRLFMLAPLVVLAAFRLRPFAAMATLAVVAATAVTFTALGIGPIAASAVSLFTRIYVLQAFIATMTVLVLPVLAVIGERDRLGLAAGHSERLFQRIAEATPAGILHVELDGSVTFANHRWTELIGAAPVTLADGGWLELVHPDDRDAALLIWDRARTLHQPTSRDLRFIGADQTTRWAELGFFPDLSDGRLHGFVVKLFDVSHRHDVEEALQQSEALYRLLAENSSDVIIRLSLDGRAHYVSNAATRLFGFEPADLVERPMASFVHPDDLAAFHSLFPAANNGRGEASAQFRHRRRRGDHVWVEATARVTVDKMSSEPGELIASLRDITARRRSEELASEAATKLREGHRLLTLAEGLAHVGHWRFDAASHSFDCSPQASLIADLPRTRQCDPGDMLGLVHAGDKRTVMRTLASARTTGAPAECSARLVLADELRHVRLVAQAEHDDRGALIGMFGVMRDVTEEEIIQAEIIRARDAAQEAARAKSDFLATMSHEIRTPMTGVLGMIDLLRSQCAEEDRDRYLATLKQSADLLMTVLDDILDFSRIEAGKIEFEEHDFDLEELMQSTLDLFDGAASQKGLLLSLEHDRAGPSIVRSDAVRLQQIVSNLLSNAIKFTAVGRVTVVLTARPVDEDSQSWRIEVRDTGIGIAPAKLGTLFEPFVQAEAATSRRFGGTGLGLAISRRLVDAMGGKVGVRSRVGRGSTFWLELTLPNGALGAADRTPAPAPVAERALDLLVAEDNPVNQMIISAILRRFGHSVTCVENGRQAVDLAGLRHFDCILMDMQMPEMDGIAATRAIRSSGGPCATTPIIALTADASSERRRFYDGAGLTDFLTKPIDRKALAERLAALTRPARIAEQVAPAADPPFSATLDEIDLDRFNELRDVLGSSRVRDLLDLLTLELDRCPARIRELVRHGDLDGARAEAHGLKGAASNVGAIALGRVAAAIEAAMNETHLGSQLEELDDQARRTVKAIAALR